MGRLVLLRHGQSLWNAANQFTGWVDVPLSEQGLAEATYAGQKCLTHFDWVYTSDLMRAKQTVLQVLKAQQDTRTPIFAKVPALKEAYFNNGESYVPVEMFSALNERCYGELQGQNKDEARHVFGVEQVEAWRRGYHKAPPGGESLLETMQRVVAVWTKYIEEKAKKHDVLVCAHGNSLRALVSHIEQLSEQQTGALELATADPRTYEYVQARWQRV